MLTFVLLLCGEGGGRVTVLSSSSSSRGIFVAADFLHNPTLNMKLQNKRPFLSFLILCELLCIQADFKHEEEGGSATTFVVGLLVSFKLHSAQTEAQLVSHGFVSHSSCLVFIKKSSFISNFKKTTMGRGVLLKRWSIQKQPPE